MSGEVALEEILGSIERGSVKDRDQAFVDLKPFLRNLSKFESIVNGDIHRLIEVLFGAISNERIAFLRIKTTASRSAAQNRLVQYSSSLRLAISIGVHLIGPAILKLIIDHILDDSFIPSGGFCEPIALEYAKCLRAVFLYQPHVEHLGQKDRERVLSFCLKCLELLTAELADIDVGSCPDRSFARQNVALTHRSFGSHTRDHNTSQLEPSVTKHLAEEIVACLVLVTAIPKVDIAKAGTILSTLISCLQQSAIASRIYQDAFTTINHILARVRVENTGLTLNSTFALVRLLRSFWSLQASKDLLITWLYIRPYIFVVIRDEHNDVFTDELRHALRCMREEFAKRHSRDQLHIDDLRLRPRGLASDSPKDIHMLTFQLRNSEMKAERHWAFLYVLASICIALSSRPSSSEECSDVDKPLKRTRKRLKLQDEVDELYTSMTTGPTSEKLCAMQTLTFVAQITPFSADQLSKAIDRLLSTCSDDSVNIASWSFLALAGLACQPEAVHETLASRWVTVFSIATRAITQTTTCRAACHVLHILLDLRLIPTTTISELAERIATAVDLGGPALLADSPTYFLSSLYQLSRDIKLSIASMLADSILGWVFRNFTPSKFEDKSYASQHVLLDPADINAILDQCMRQELSSRYPAYTMWDSVGQAWLHCLEHQALIKYLLLITDETHLRTDGLWKTVITTKTVAALQPSKEMTALDHLNGELYETQETWSSMIRDRPQAISLDVFACFCNVCCVITNLAYTYSFIDKTKQEMIQIKARNLLNSLSTFAASVNCQQDKLDVLLGTFTQFFSGLAKPVPTVGGSETEKVLCQTLSKTMSMRHDTHLIHRQTIVEEDFSMDELGESQESRRGMSLKGAQTFANERAAALSPFALRTNATMYATFVTMSLLPDSTLSGASDISSTAMDYVLSLSPLEVLLGGEVIASLPSMGVNLTTVDSHRLLEHCAEHVLEAYEYECSEVALSLTLEIMSSFVLAWTNPENNTLCELGNEIYEWFTNTALKAGTLSSNNQDRLATVLLQLCQIDPEFGRREGGSSARTSLFNLVRLGTTSVQFRLSSTISSIFGHFVLSTHSRIFDDLQASLPDHSQWVEGMAMRLLFLAELASTWHSLLRQCIYYMFETAARVKTSGRHASWCIEKVARNLGYNTGREIFELFAPQLLHTWLESHSVNTLPFAAFQYGTLEDLLACNQAEVTAQILMRGNDNDLAIVCNALHINEDTLVRRSFSKSLAYCISWDISKPQQAQETAENRLRKLIGGKDELRNLAVQQFPTIVGHFFLTLQSDDGPEKWLERHADYDFVKSANIEMHRYGHSTQQLPPCQQPSFKGKFIFDQLARLCRRTSYDPIRPWNASMLAVTIRMILDSIDVALGSLHACLALRRLRLLISMASEVACSGYCLEILIRSVLPFIGDTQCADDAIGIIQFLLERGKDYLKQHSLFVYGTITVAVLRLQAYSKKEQDSTTQESQHKDTLRKMENLKFWLVRYLRDFQESSVSEAPISYGHIATLLAEVSLPGNARRGSRESDLLLLLLSQSFIGQQSIMSQADWQESLVLLTTNFEQPDADCDSCLSSNDEYAMYVDGIWQSFQIRSLDENYIIWAGGVIGKAYASTGMRPIQSKGDHRQYKSESPREVTSTSVSQKTIAKRLCESLASQNRTEASLAEYTLRKIASSFRTEEEALAFEQTLPQSVASTIAGGNFEYMPLTSYHENLGLLNDSSIQEMLESSGSYSLHSFVRRLSLYICGNAPRSAVLSALSDLLHTDACFAAGAFPAILHISLEEDILTKGPIQETLSKSLNKFFELDDEGVRAKQQFLIKAFLYMRRQPFPGEHTIVDRLRWLKLDLMIAARAAARSDLPTAALMLLESVACKLHDHDRRSFGRSTISQLDAQDIPQDLLLSIFRQLEEPDSFYGVEQSSSLNSILGRLDYEADGLKSLMFRSAQSDAQLRSSHRLAYADSAGIARSLSMLSMHSLNFMLLSASHNNNAFSSEEMLSAACKLQQWNIIPPDSSASSMTMFGVLQDVSQARSQRYVQSKLNSAIMRHMHSTLKHLEVPTHLWFGILASLAEIREIMSTVGTYSLHRVWAQMEPRESWMAMSQFYQFQGLMSNRHNLFSILAENTALQNDMRLETIDFRLLEIKSLLKMSSLSQDHGHLQEALSAATQVGDLVRDLQVIGHNVDAAANFEISSVLWHLGEESASITMLKNTLASSNLDAQVITVPRSQILARLGHYLAEARLEKPEEIMSHYLQPAITDIATVGSGSETGSVFHEFAAFCDKQLQNAENIEDFGRISRIRQTKMDEVQQLEQMAKKSRKYGDPTDYKHLLKKAKQWLAIDEDDYQRLKTSRDTFVQQSLKNYLLTLQVTEKHDASVLRFVALWLEYSQDAPANAVVNEVLPTVASWKFVRLLNQLMSRLENNRSSFQDALQDLVFRIYAQHPHHSLHFLYAYTRKPQQKDHEATKSRTLKAAEIRARLLQHLAGDTQKSDLMKNWFVANNLYNALAWDDVQSVKGTKASIKEVPAAYHVATRVPQLRVPPATLTLSLLPSGDYADVPTITKFESVLRVMSGLSKPKKMVAIASDGQQYAALFKSGNDDLRQDAIMEQVFEEVSQLLQEHKITRQRNLHVRTYKVIPLSNKAGIIEFVPNSTSLSDFLTPTHMRYHPSDLKPTTAREKIHAIKDHSAEVRVKEYKKVCAHMHPVLRYFFFEKFTDPDEWFQKRTAYTRTTASVSILGHVLGLGDRHCQNIMLDERTGEVIHIDLGVAFEAGRVLPIPELVPFRLTRDIVDGMGITKIEGVFRRCCEFTLDALRRDKDRIMTLLNVLRYDPLYQWTISPLRAKRMQERTETDQNGAIQVGLGSSKESDASEAERALSVVEKKLSKTLSTSATVNELIQQATDERNLATLFSGWAAYF